MPLEPRASGRIHTGVPRRPFPWTCPSCDAAQEGRPEQGCSTCGAGADGHLGDGKQPVFDVSTLPESLDSPVATFEEVEAAGEGGLESGEGDDPMTENPTPPPLRPPAAHVHARTPLHAQPDAAPQASVLDKLRGAADERQYNLVRAAVFDVFEQIKGELLLNLPGVLIPKEAAFPVSIALRALAEEIVKTGPLDGIPDHEQLIQWADLLAPAPTASSDDADII